jgi:hypothetical protein
MQMLTEQDYRAAPDDPEEKFAYLAEKYRTRIANAYPSNVEHLDDASKRQYLAVMTELAKELDIKSINIHRTETIDRQFVAMLAVNSAFSQKILLRRTSANRESVRLTSSTRIEIEKKISRLRIYIEQADMPSAKRKELLIKLDELREALGDNRVVMSKALIILSSIILGTTTFLAEVPDALKTAASIVASIARDKEAENAERERLEAPAAPLAIEDRRSSTED